MQISFCGEKGHQRRDYAILAITQARQMAAAAISGVNEEQTVYYTPGESWAAREVDMPYWPSNFVELYGILVPKIQKAHTAMKELLSF